MTLSEIESLIRANSKGHSETSINSWLNNSTLCRFQQWVPSPTGDQTRLLDIGCYQPAIGYYAALGWREVIGIAKEEGECNSIASYSTESGTKVSNFILDVEVESISEASGSVDVVLMMEVFEHFGLDPMHALIEANRVLRPNGLLVLSTPNATAIASLRRMTDGRNPYDGLEFSGFSTNRHNRLYDAEELRRVMQAAGFEIDLCTSQSYSHLPAQRFRWTALSIFWKCNDAWVRSRTGRQIERGDYLFVRAKKRGPPIDRYPSLLYFDPKMWPDWFVANKKTSR